MRKMLFSCYVAFIFGFLLMPSCATVQKFFTTYETFEVKHNDVTLDVKMPPEIPIKYIKAEDSQYVFIQGSFFAVRYAFDDVYTYDFLDFLLEYGDDTCKIKAVICWNLSTSPEPEAWLYVNERPFPSSTKKIIKFLQDKINARGK